MLAGLGNRAVDEGYFKLVCKRRERLPKDIDKAHGLGDEPLKLGQEGAVGVRSKVNTVPLLAPGEYPRRYQRCQRLLEASRAAAQVLGQVAQIPPALGLERRGRKQPLGGLANQRVDGTCLTHIS